MQGVSAKVNQWKQLLHMREITLYPVHILIELGAFFPMCLFHCLDMPYQFFVLTFKGGYALLQFLPFRFQLIATQQVISLLDVGKLKELEVDNRILQNEVTLVTRASICYNSR